jgi:hypothetical protein
LPDEIIASACMHLYLRPVSPNIYQFLRIALLLGEEFSEWLYRQFHKKWGHHPQPPTFFRTLKRRIPLLKSMDARLVATGLKPTVRFTLPGEKPMLASELLGNVEVAAAMLSKACIGVFEGSSADANAARQLDVITYGGNLRSRAPTLGADIKARIANKLPGDVLASDESE